LIGCGDVFIFKVNKGEVPPSFTLKDQDGKTVSLSKFKGKPVVVYFYPADESPSCTKQVTRSVLLQRLSFLFMGRQPSIDKIM
jgi:peroxiredoxin